MTFLCLCWTELGKLQGHFQHKPYLQLVISKDDNMLWQWNVCCKWNVLYIFLDSMTSQIHTYIELHEWIYVIPNSVVYIQTNSIDFSRGRIPNKSTYNYTWDKNVFCLYYSLILKGKTYFIMIMQVSAIYNSYILGNSDFSWLKKFCLTVVVFILCV